MQTNDYIKWTRTSTKFRSVLFFVLLPNKTIFEHIKNIKLTMKKKNNIITECIQFNSKAKL